MAERDERVEGYANKETFTLCTFIDNDQGELQFWQERGAEVWEEATQAEEVREGTWTRAQAAKFHLADEMKEHYQERYEGIEYVKPEPLALLWTGLLQDALGTVDWEDAAECYLPDEAKDALSE